MPDNQARSVPPEGIEPDPEPQVERRIGETRLTLLGTAHISQASADKVEELITGGAFDAIAIELCPSRHQAMTAPDSVANMDLLQVIRQGKATMIAAHLALGAYQKRMAEQLGIQPGAEMRMAIEQALARGLPILLIDREVSVTLRRVYRNVPWWQRLQLVSALVLSIVSRQRVSESEIERLKEGDLLESAFTQFAERAQALYVPLIEERDRYMSARLVEEVGEGGYERVLAVVGAGHLKGMSVCLDEDHVLPVEAARRVVADLETVPRPSRWPRLIPWAVVALILAGFVLGFAHSPSMGWRMVADWVFINGGLSAAGTLLAAGHPLTVLTAFLAAPLTSLNPMIGAGMVTAAAETWLRRPNVGDFARLRDDTTHLRGWWRNRVARILMVFVLSTLGSAIGTYVAGALIFKRLAAA